MTAVHRVMGLSVKVAAVAALMVALTLGGVVWLAIELTSGSASEETAPDTVVFGDSITRLSSDRIVAETGATVVAYDGAKWADLGPAVPQTLGELAEPPQRPNTFSDNEWSILANRNLEQHGGTWFEGDEVHPNGVGQAKLATSFAAALDRHCGKPFG